MKKYKVDLKKRSKKVKKGLLETGSKNWLRVKNEGNGQIFSISKYCRASHLKFNNGREYFKILDWPNKNVLASVIALPDERSRFGNVDYNNGAVLEYDYKTKVLVVNPGNIKVRAGFDTLNQLANGSYKIRLADHPHSYGSPYLDRTSYALTWFFIDDNDNLDRYIHAGQVSEGCLSVGEESAGGTNSDIVKWTEIARLLLTQRYQQKESYVGVLNVKGL